MKSDFYERLGARISELRKMRGLTQEDLAAACELTTSYVSKIESGTRKPTLDAIGAIAEALSIPMGMLFPDDAAAVPVRLAIAVRGLSDDMLDAVIALARNLSKASKPRRRR